MTSAHVILIAVVGVAAAVLFLSSMVWLASELAHLFAKEPPVSRETWLPDDDPRRVGTYGD